MTKQWEREYQPRSERRGGAPRCQSWYVLQPAGEPMRDKIFTAAHKVAHARADGRSCSLQRVRSGAEQNRIFLTGLQPIENPALAQIFKMWTAPHGKPIPEQIFFPAGQQHMGRAHAGAGEKQEREGGAERNCYVQTIPPNNFPCPSRHHHAAQRGRGVWSEGVKLGLGNRGGKAF